MSKKDRIDYWEARAKKAEKLLRLAYRKISALENAALDEAWRRENHELERHDK